MRKSVKPRRKMCIRDRGVTDDETLGRIYVEDMEAIDVPEHLLNYFDYEAYGRDIRLNEDGHYAPGGYVLNNGVSFIEHYHGREDIPDEHKVCLLYTSGSQTRIS